jgi:crotonobetainyl-CoA:carnitine CoA-transferase CaiB-like acyl-CoA transferase
MFWSPVNSPDEILSDPQLAHAGGLIEVPDAQGSTTKMINSPADFHGSPSIPRALAPALGEHTRSILREVGRSDAEIEELLSSKVVAETVT